MSTSAAFETARDLIRSGRYADARRVLESINTPQSQEWLGKLEILERQGKKTAAPAVQDDLDSIEFPVQKPTVTSGPAVEDFSFPEIPSRRPIQPVKTKPQSLTKRLKWVALVAVLLIFIGGVSVIILSRQPLASPNEEPLPTMINIAAVSSPTTFASDLPLIMTNTVLPATVPPTMTNTVLPATMQPTQTLIPSATQIPTRTTVPNIIASTAVPLVMPIPTFIVMDSMFVPLTNPITCSGNLPSRMEKGSTGRITPGLGNNLREQASTHDRLLDVIPTGAGFIMLDGPVCAEGFTWWQVQYVNQIGWTVEATADEYWIEQLVPAQPRICSGSLPSLLYKGGSARVSDGEPNNIRTSPESSTIRGQIPAGQIASILDGPVCGSQLNKIWWRVTYNGIEGWTAESDTNEYWLLPVFPN